MFLRGLFSHNTQIGFGGYSASFPLKGRDPLLIFYLLGNGSLTQ